MADALQAVSWYSSIFPGNALGSTPIPTFPDASQSVKVGAGAKETGWSAWVADIKSGAYAVINPLSAIMPTAGEIVKKAETETSTFISSSVNKAVGAVTGLGGGVTDFLSGFKDTVKYLAIGIIGLAVIYVMATLVAPVVAAGKK